MAAPRSLARFRFPFWQTWGQSARRRQPGRSYWNILGTNLFSFFNIILFSVSLVLLAFGRTNDALITGVTAVFSALIRTVQEIRAKQQLDQIALLVHPQAMVVRDGGEQLVDAAELTAGDLIHLRTGDQALADGIVVGDSSAEVDESLLTGESDLVRKRAGDRIFSGSFCVSGALRYTAEAVGDESYAGQLSTSARTYQAVATPLERAAPRWAAPGQRHRAPPRRPLSPQPHRHLHSRPSLWRPRRPPLRPCGLPSRHRHPRQRRRRPSLNAPSARYALPAGPPSGPPARPSSSCSTRMC